mmetsp:Transcript_26872/g.48597  ORF Transcript_26872/g.48597 Transcript_26872/m.48597 type:complete len:193 (+) Transcript_26872:47-625(+)
MKIAIVAGSLLALSTMPAVAGPPETADATEPARPPAVAAPFSGAWTGAYGGVQLGFADVDATGAADGDDTLYGVHAGYAYDFGTFVLGGELDYDLADIDLNGAARVDGVARLKLRAGYDFGRTLGYVTLGAAELDSSLGRETGGVYGFGFAYQVNDRYLLGAEVLDHRFDDINGTGVDADATTLTLRGSIRF